MIDPYEFETSFSFWDLFGVLGLFAFGFLLGAVSTYLEFGGRV
jgi:hypothetical protein